MCLRHATRRKGGKVATYRQLVHPVRRGRKIVQHTVEDLGGPDAQARAHAEVSARAITGERDSPISSGRGAV